MMGHILSKSWAVDNDAHNYNINVGLTLIDFRIHNYFDLGLKSCRNAMLIKHTTYKYRQRAMESLALWEGRIKLQA